MAVYIDSMAGTPKTAQWPYAIGCHLIADTVDELHTFAQGIGMLRAWFQPQSSPHYDLTATRRARAIASGAVECTVEEFVHHIWRIRGVRPGKGGEDG